MSEEADSYKHHYAILIEIVNTLRTQQEPDIDALIPMVEKATAAYKVCKSRIDAVKETKLPTWRWCVKYSLNGANL
jgi:exodeoxyribonuclease VII small subunit